MTFCCNHDIKELRDLSLRIKNNFSKAAKDEVNSLYYGYECGGDEDSKDKLKTYQGVLDNYLKQLSLLQRDAFRNEKNEVVENTKTCLSCDDLQCLLEKIRKIIGKDCAVQCSVLTIDDSQEEMWILDNPTCVSYECWNKWSKIISSKLDVQLTVESQKDLLILELHKETISPNVAVALRAVKEANDLELEVSRTIEESKIDFKLLLEKEDIDFDFKTYLKLTKNNLSFDIISEIYKNKLSLEIESDCVYLKTSLSKYPINEIGLNLTYLKSLGKEMDIELKNLLVDFKKIK